MYAMNNYIANIQSVYKWKLYIYIYIYIYTVYMCVKKLLCYIGWLVEMMLQNYYYYYYYSINNNNSNK